MFDYGCVMCCCLPRSPCLEPPGRAGGSWTEFPVEGVAVTPFQWSDLPPLAGRHSSSRRSELPPLVVSGQVLHAGCTIWFDLGGVPSVAILIGRLELPLSLYLKGLPFRDGRGDGRPGGFAALSNFFVVCSGHRVSNGINLPAELGKDCPRTHPTAPHPTLGATGSSVPPPNIDPGLQWN